MAFAIGKRVTVLVAQGTVRYSVFVDPTSLEPRPPIEDMVRLLVRAALGLTLGLPPLAASAQTDDFVNGLMTKIDESAGKIIIKHGPLKKFGMDEGMTMVFRAADPAMFKAVKPGDKVRFVPDRINSQFAIMKIEKAK